MLDKLLQCSFWVLITQWEQWLAHVWKEEEYEKI